MGNRFITKRFVTGKPYSSRRISQMLNEADFEAHRSKPYGMGAGKFSYLQMFQKSRSRSSGSLRERRVPKKTERQNSRKELRNYYAQW